MNATLTLEPPMLGRLASALRNRTRMFFFARQATGAIPKDNGAVVRTATAETLPTARPAVLDSVPPRNRASPSQSSVSPIIQAQCELVSTMLRARIEGSGNHVDGPVKSRDIRARRNGETKAG
jgi:hypothetical protein